MSEAVGESGGRAEARSNIFVAATLASAEASGPVRVRNLSPLGALIEGGVVPPEGAHVLVNRGRLRASGTVAWRSGNRAGIRFDTAISVTEWLPRGLRTQQQRIDGVVHAYKSGSAALATPDEKRAHSPTDLQNTLLNLERTLRRVAEDLARDALMCERHLTNVQLIDVAAQKLARLAAESD
jgi:hypothetical protein